MSGRGILDVPMLECLPLRLRQDPDMVALCKVTDILLELVYSQIRNIAIWTRIDELEAPILDNLAYAMHLEGYEGWHLATTLDQKRSLIKDAYKTHFYKGTRWSIERVFRLLDIPGDVTEWWESDEGTEAFPPYTFDMDVRVGDRTVSPSLVTDTLGLIDALKNLRSHLRRGTIHITGPTAPVHVGGALTTSATVRVGPNRPTKITSKENTPKVGAVAFSAATVHVGPLRPTKVTSRATTPKIGGAAFAVATVRVEPLREQKED